MQPCCSVLQRLWLPLLTALVVSFAVQFYWSAWIPADTKCSNPKVKTQEISPHPSNHPHKAHSCRKHKHYVQTARKMILKVFILTRCMKRRYNSLPVEVIQAGLDVGIVIVHLVLIEGCFGVECRQCLLELHQLGFPPLSVASLVANVLSITGFTTFLQSQKVDSINKVLTRYH